METSGGDAAGMPSTSGRFASKAVAVSVIESAWMGYRNKRIFKYYRDLIRFREKGDPKEILKCINPREASLIDAAAGIHVRFRLGGSVFPPLLFYKIYTHRAVTDICAFGPRNYWQESRLSSADLHNHAPAAALSPQQQQQQAASSRAKRTLGPDFQLDETLREYIRPDGSVGLRSVAGWYERHENNGWRPVSERVLLEEDPVTTMTRLRRLPFFHFSPTVRREEVVAQRKQRKREWLARLYAEGRRAAQEDGAGSTGDEGDEPSAFDAEGYAALKTKRTAEVLQSGDDDDDEGSLLDWSEHLDFESYVENWTSVACTLGSEAYAPLPDGPQLAASMPRPGAVASKQVQDRLYAQAGGTLPRPFIGGATASSSVTTYALQ